MKWKKGYDFIDDTPRWHIEGYEDTPRYCPDPKSASRWSAIITVSREPEMRGLPKVLIYTAAVSDGYKEAAIEKKFRKVSEAKKWAELTLANWIKEVEI